MSKKCACNGGIAGFSGDGFMDSALSIGAGYAGFVLGEMATDNISMLSDNRLLGGGIKTGVAVSLPMIMSISAQWQLAGLVGLGISGIKDIITGLDDTAAANGYDSSYDWDNYDPYKNRKISANDMM
jgi:hypothetical protein